MCGSSGSHFFRTTTGIQSGPSAYDESRFVMTFLTNSRVLEWKVGKRIPESSRLEFLEKFSTNKFALLDVDGNT